MVGGKTEKKVEDKRKKGREKEIHERGKRLKMKA
jgi:hypothetical protein